MCMMRRVDDDYLRSAGVAPRFGSGRAGPAAGHARGRRCWWPTRSAAACCSPPRCPASCPAPAKSCSARRCACRRSAPGGAASRRPWSSWSSTSTGWSSRAPSRRSGSIRSSAATLRGAPRDELIERLRARPQAYVAQELVRFSQAPSWSAPHERRLLPRGVALRVYVAATPQGYRVMPGGLTRVTSATDARFISMQRGGSSKDTWVLSDEPVNTTSA